MAATNLEEEIAIYQFGQGVQSDRAILDHFIQLHENTKRMRLYDLYSLILDLNPVDADIDQGIADSSLLPTDAPCVTLKKRRLRKGLFFLPDGDTENVFELLLYVFKSAYYRQYVLNRENPASWWYRDLSKPEIVQDILKRHYELAEEIYNNPSFRSEFVCLAKLWYEYRTLKQAKVEEPEPEIQTKFNFITYDEMIIGSVSMIGNTHLNGIGVLDNSVSKGLAVRYKLTSEQARLLMVDVIERHMQEIYKLDWRPNF